MSTALERARERNDLLSRLLCAAQKLDDVGLQQAIAYLERKVKKAHEHR